MIHLAALITQKPLRDLSALPKLGDEVAWFDADTLAAVSEPAVIVATWLGEDGAAASEVLKKRAEAGRTTILVPRFKAGDLRPILKSPAAVKIRLGAFDMLRWQDEEEFGVSGQTVIDTPLHAGHWGHAAQGSLVVFAYRPHEGAGHIVLCTASLTSRQAGVKVAEQRRLLHKLLAAVTAGQPIKPIAPAVVPLAPVATLMDFLADGDRDHAATAFLVAVCDGRRDPQVLAGMAKRMGFDVCGETLSAALARMPDAPLDELLAGLRKCGWSAYLRRSRQLLPEGDDA